MPSCNWVELKTENTDQVSNSRRWLTRLAGNRQSQTSQHPQALEEDIGRSSLATRLRITLHEWPIKPLSVCRGESENFLFVMCYDKYRVSNMNAHLSRMVSITDSM